MASIGQCIWNTDVFHNVDKTSVKLKSEVASDEDTAEFNQILMTGNATKVNKSNYAENYRLFQTRIGKFKEDSPGDFSYLPMRILDNCILLPIEVDSQNTALRIFTTLNDRGMPLTDADIFRAQFYKFFSRNGGKQAKDNFTQRWNTLTKLCKKNFHPKRGTKTDDLFRRYAKTKKAIEENKRISDTFSDMRDFYAENDYKILLSKQSFEELETLVNFWEEINTRNEKFSQEVLKRLYTLNYSPYSVWSYVVSLYFMSHRDLDEEKFCAFLDKVTAMILMNAVLDLGKQTIRRPFVLEFKDIYNGEPLEFDRQFKCQENIFRRRLADMRFSNNKPITRAMLAWWTFRDSAQKLPPLGAKLEIEHIYAKNRHENFEPLNNPDALEFLGNKVLLEKRINIGAADYRFADKKKYYLSWQPPGKGKKYQDGTFNQELLRLAKTHSDFTEDDILARNEEIFDAFIAYLREQNLLV